jgi:hypothetical protein
LVLVKTCRMRVVYGSIQIRKHKPRQRRTTQSLLYMNLKTALKMAHLLKIALALEHLHHFDRP